MSLRQFITAVLASIALTLASELVKRSKTMVPFWAYTLGMTLGIVAATITTMAA